MASQSAITNYADAAKTLQANLSPRQRDLEVLERFVEGTQYDGLEDWFSDTDTPLWERAPCIVYPIVGTAIRSNVDLVLGESRFPAITSNPGEDDSDAEGLDEEASKKVDRAIAELSTRVRFRALARQALEHGQGARSVATIVGVRNGRPFLEHVRSRFCEPTFDADGRVTKLEVRYPYVSAPKRQPDGSWKVDILLYRRTIDDKADTTYLPLPADKSGREPKAEAWTVDKDRTIEHKLGFCPVHWYAHMRECTTVANFDGVAIHERQLDEIRGLDFALSQRHRAALFCGDPQIIEIGVEPGYNPSGFGRTAVVPATLKGGAPSATNPVTGHYRDTSAQAARKKSPGIVWQYEGTTGKDVKVEYLALPPGALDALDEHAADLRNKIAEALAVVILDPENVKITGAMSGKAIEMLRSRQFDRCDQYRDDFAACWLLPVILLLLRVAIATDVRSPAVEAARKELEAYVSDDASAPMLFVRWPAGYLQPDHADEQAVVNACVTAKKEGVATLRMVVEKLAPIFGIVNVDQAVEAIEEERAKNAEELHASMKALAAAGAGPGADAAGNDDKRPPGLNEEAA